MRAAPPSLLIPATLVMLLAGCSGQDIAERIGEEVAEQAGGGEVDINTDDGSVSVDTEEGSFNIGNQEVPDELPEELPLPEGLTVLGSVAQSNADGDTVGLQATYEAGFDDAVSFFDAELEANDWTITENTSTDVAGGLSTQSWQVEGHGYTGVLGVTQLGEDGAEDASTSVTVNLQATP